MATFSSYCGGIKSWRLTDKRYQHDATKGSLLPEKSLMTMTDGNRQDRAVPPAQLADLPACGAFEVNFAPSTFVIPRNVVSEGRAGLQDRGPLHLLVGPARLVKTFTVIPESYLAAR